MEKSCIQFCRVKSISHWSMKYIWINPREILQHCIGNWYNIFISSASPVSLSLSLLSVLWTDSLSFSLIFSLIHSLQVYSNVYLLTTFSHIGIFFWCSNITWSLKFHSVCAGCECDTNSISLAHPPISFLSNSFNHFRLSHRYILLVLI